MNEDFASYGKENRLHLLTCRVTIFLVQVGGAFGKMLHIHFSAGLEIRCCMSSYLTAFCGLCYIFYTATGHFCGCRTAIFVYSMK